MGRSLISYFGNDSEVTNPFIDLHYETEGKVAITAILYRDREAIKNNEEPLTSDYVIVNIAACNCAYPDAIIDSPTLGQQIHDKFVINGRAHHPQLDFYKLEIIYEARKDDNNPPRKDWITSVFEPKTGDLGTVDTTRYPDGSYRLRLSVVDIPRTSEHYCEVPVTIANNTPIRVDSLPTVNVPDANLRAGPGTDFDITGSATPGQAVTIIGQITRNAQIWYQLSDGNWIISDLVDNAPSDIPSAQNVPDLSVPPSLTPTPSHTVVHEEPKQTPDWDYELNARIVVVRYEATIQLFRRCMYNALNDVTSDCNTAEDIIADIIQQIDESKALVNNVTPNDKYKTVQDSFFTASIYFGTVAQVLAKYVEDSDQAWLERAAHQLEIAENEINKAKEGLTALRQ